MTHSLVFPHSYFIISLPVQTPSKISTQAKDEFTKSRKVKFSLKVLEITFSNFFVQLSKFFLG